jgi:hypothetical protein
MAIQCAIADLSVFKVPLNFLINIRNQLGAAEPRFDIGGNGGEEGVMLA